MIRAKPHFAIFGTLQVRRDQRGLSLRFTVCRSPRMPRDRARSPPQKPVLVTDGIRPSSAQRRKASVVGSAAGRFAPAAFR
jgi:hypothetical protein